MRAGYIAAACGLVLLAGCGGNAFSGLNHAEGSPGGATSAGASLKGVVHGGQNPIVGAKVYLLAAASGAASGGNGAGAAAYGGAGIAASASNQSQSLLNAAVTGQSDSIGAYVTTGPGGSFAITGDYTCTAGQQVYLYVLGGDPGLGTGVNSVSGLMAALGACPTGGTFLSGSNPIPVIIVNEVSTVAAAYSMAGFATDATHVGSSGTALAQTGIANAFANAANLETIGTGVALATTPAANGTVPQSEIDTLADILAACVNSNGTVTGPTNATPCYTLVTNATADGTTTGAQPADTATAAINIAHHPGVNVANLYGLSTANPPFAGGLTTQPNDFTIALNFTGSGITATTRFLAIDAAGNAWIVNEQNPGSIAKLSPSGAVFSPPATYTGGGLVDPTVLALDGSGNAWIADVAGNDVSEFSSTGASIPSGGGGYTAGDLVDPYGVAIDGSGDAWISDVGTSPSTTRVTKLSPSGGVLSGATGFAVGQLNVPKSIAIDGSGSAWIANLGGNTVSKLSSAGGSLSGTSGFTGTEFSTPVGVALDAAGNAWITNNGNNSITKLSNTGTLLSGTTGFTGGGVNAPALPAIDGGGNVWTTSTGGSVYSVNELSSAGVAISPTTGYRGGALDIPNSIAVDGSGNLWIPNLGNASVTEFVGAATPVITPIVAGLPATPTLDGSSNLGTRP